MNRESGQSTIEFLLGFSIVLMLLLLMLRISLQYTNGYFLHYATFMASRTYMVVDVDDNDESGSDGFAAKKSQEVFDKFLVTKLISTFDGKITFQSPDEVPIPLFSGAYTEFKEKLSPISAFGGDSQINFRSESFLRREPGRATCLEQVCNAIKALGISDCTSHVTLYDNGC